MNALNQTILQQLFNYAKHMLNLNASHETTVCDEIIIILD